MAFCAWSAASATKPVELLISPIFTTVCAIAGNAIRLSAACRHTSAAAARQYPIAILPPARETPNASLFLRVQLLPRVLDHRDRRDLDIGELSIHLLGATDIDVLHDVAGRRVDLDRTARAVRVLPFLEELHRLVGGELAVGRLDQVE